MFIQLRRNSSRTRLWWSLHNKSVTGKPQRVMASSLCSSAVATAAILLCLARISAAQLVRPLNCSDPQRTCTAFLHYLLPQEQTIQDVEAMFNAWAPDITMEGNSSSMFIPASPLNQKSLFIRIPCSCSSSSHLYGHITAPARTNISDYEGLAWKNGSDGKSVWMRCGCSSDTVKYPYLISHVIQAGDTLEMLSLRFGSNSSDITFLNRIRDPTFLADGVVYYIPVSSAPGISLTAIPPSAANEGVADENKENKKKVRFSLGAIIAVASAGAVLLALTLGCILIRGSTKKREASSVLRTPAFSRELMTKVTNVERPLVFSYEEVEAATDCFKESNKLGQGAYGSVFYGVLRDQEVAVKRMNSTMAKEFLAEVKVLCKVHHTNLVELIGYASCADELFLVYEYAENKSLSDRLHDPLSKGYTPLSWVLRVQIALDAARGIEYIHDHTKAHYVHRDIKTSNILLDGSFRAKVADFGLAKLVEQGEENASVTRIVGTFGYLAPEYLRDGQATTKSDVYAFGVVLFELITGQEAIAKSKLHIPSTPERRSLISIMFSALKDATPTNIGKLREVADPLLENMYPSDCMHRVAVLAKQCVEEDPHLRPDMKQVVFTLSHVLFNSIEWEATLAGNSQVFSKIMQGR